MSEPMQFDTVERGDDEAAPAHVSACRRCQAALAQRYYELRGLAAEPEIVCPSCHDRAKASYEAGAGFGGFARSFLFGVGGGAAGFALYWGVLALTGYEVGLISIAVGLLVGVAVRMGSGGRGGRLRQLLAAFLAYTAIVMSYVPGIVAELTGGAEPMPTVVAVVLAVPFAYLAPFLTLVEGASSVIGLLIIGFGVWEAWKLNQARDVELLGPFTIGAQEPEGGTPGDVPA